MRKYTITCLLLVLMQAAYAQDVATTSAVNSSVENTTANSGQSTNPKDWGLTQAEWTRYQQLMQGASGRWYAQLTPAGVLGVNAQTPDELKYFAELIAREQHDKLAHELAFDRAIHEAALRLYQDEPVIKPFDLSPFNPQKAANHKAVTTLQSGDHLVLFVDPNNGIDFTALPRLLAAVKSNSGVVLDIYCTNKADDSVIREWAKINSIPTNLVSKGRITLNQNGGKLQHAAGQAQLPYVLLVRNGESQPISLWSFS